MSNLNITAKEANTYDAIVIGSGVSGGWAAKELTEKGLRVLMLERGRQLHHVAGYENAMKAPWETNYHGKITLEQAATHPKLSRDANFNENTAPYWMTDADALYEETKRFDWFRPNIVGGKSIMWGRQCYRLSDLDFEANAKEGIAIDWPIRYRDIESWYSYVEKFAGISGEALGLPHLPDSEFLPPMDMFFVEKEVRTELSDEPEVLAEMLKTLGVIQLAFDDPERSRGPILSAHDYFSHA
jgi:choline dehydrogenase-like flavoprotein